MRQARFISEIRRRIEESGCGVRWQRHRTPRRPRRSRGLLVIHHSSRFALNDFLILSGRAPHCKSFSREPEYRSAVLENELHPGALVHLWEVDAAEKET